MVKIIAEIGINHNGDLDIAKKLIDVAASSGCDYVKFQKRNPDICVPEHQKKVIRSTPWGEMTYLDYKKRTEFNRKQYDKIDSYCKSRGIDWFASVWDKDSVDFMSKYKTSSNETIMKIPSALITDLDLCIYARSKCNKLLVSTGMSDNLEINACLEACEPEVIFHTNSTYPCPVEDLNLNFIKVLQEQEPYKEIGYSGHEYGLVTTFAAVALGVTWVERHITLNRNMWGTDQKSSIEPSGLFKLVKGIRDIENSLGSEGVERVITPGELEKRKSLRK